MNGADHVTVCVPVHNGRDFVAETLTAIQRQTHPTLTVLISDDASEEGSAEICRAFTRDPRFRLVVQPERLGWIRNCNWLLANADSELLCIQPHDDLPQPEYIARLVACLAAEPDCALAFTDIQVFGLYDRVYRQDSICGSALERVLAVISRHYDGTAWRGLMRQRARDAVGLMRGNRNDDFAADIAWLARVAQVGSFRRIPEKLYRKRRRAGSVSLRWGHWDDTMRADAWCIHCCELLRDGLAMPLSHDEKWRLVRAVLAEFRLHAHGSGTASPATSRTPSARRA